jgi:predicted PurR-regulated permease PerM
MSTPNLLRISRQAWLSLLSLGICLWLIITQADAILALSGIFFGAFLLSLAIHPIADHLAAWHIPRSVTVLLIYLGLVLLLGGLILLLVPVLEGEIDHLMSTGPNLTAQLMALLAHTPLAGYSPSFDGLAQALLQRLDLVFADTVITVERIGSLAIDLLVLLILAYFFALDSTPLYPWIATWIAAEHHNHLQQVWGRITQRLSRWVWAQVAIATYFAIAFGIGLSLIGIPYAWTIGLVGGLLEIVPFLGGLIAFLLAFFSALAVDPVLALWVIVLYLVIAGLESHLLAPILYGRAIGLRSALVLIALVAGTKIGGVAGVFFAVPVAVILSALIQELHPPKDRAATAPSAPLSATSAPLPSPQMQE